MSNKVILIIMDGVGYQTARTQCGYLEGAVNAGLARCWKMKATPPTISASMYETIHTGLTPIAHGITGNTSLRRSIKPNIFSLCRAAGKRTAAVGHSYFYKLYVDQPWDPLRSVEHHDENSDIQIGRYYSMEGYGRVNPTAPAEIDLCGQMIVLTEKWNPDYLLFHTCSTDSIGHFYGGDSPQYRRQTMDVDDALGRTIPILLTAGYEIMVTADHGMTAEGGHGGTEDVVCDIPFYYFGPGAGPDGLETLDQLGIAAAVLDRIGIAPADGMGASFLSGSASE
ncbi:alkaline phosphatase family protein [Sneathiella sp.]|uniref:alkaline phosphatase family protein n=1 Tax=Sneathiella sp. TaxID=1964365 RepID=UPI00260E5A5F|nr:alkaline phosphatase family protein [Sneathiella sp.]MDF2368190.1 alkaline phosphatase family protein [Sneathiella sp.]